MSCAGNGYLTGNTLVAFPFEDGQSLAWPHDVSGDDAQSAIQKCFADASVFVDRTGVSDEDWPRIGCFSSSGTTLSFVLSACGEQVAISVTAGQEPFPIVSGQAPFGSYVIVLCSDAIREFCFSGFPPPVTGTSSTSWREEGCSMRICERCVTVRPAGLDSVRVFDGVAPEEYGTGGRGYSKGDTCAMDGAFYVCIDDVPAGSEWDGSKWDYVSLFDTKRRNPSFTLSGDISLKPGNNMLLSDPGGSGIRLDAVPGAGMGVVPCGCDESRAVSRLFSHDGHTRIFNGTCYDIEPVFEEIEDGWKTRRIGRLIMHGKCTACCTCEMYASIVNDRLVPLANAIRSAKSAIFSESAGSEGMLKKYNDAVDAFNERIESATIDDVQVSLTGMPVGKNLSSKLSGTDVSGKMRRCAFTAIVRNSAFQKISVCVRELSAGDDEIVEASASWSDDDGAPKSASFDSAESIVGTTFVLSPGRSLVITFVSRSESMVSSVETGGYRGSISVGLSYLPKNGAFIDLGVVKRSVEVENADS